MAYNMPMITRHIEKTLNAYSEYFPSVLVSGARQVGKTTLLKTSKKTKDANIISFDERESRDAATNDPNLFISLNKPPLIIDEVQYVPSIFSYLKIAIDKDRHNGMYYLTGSQPFNLMKNVSESLAGRIGILEMMNISLREEIAEDFDKPFLPSREYLINRNGQSVNNLWNKIYRGFFPELIANPNIPPSIYYDSYKKTYLERDLRELSAISDLGHFEKFLRLIATRVGTVINYTDISSLLSLSDKTIKRWVTILEQSGIAFHVEAFFGNTDKRIIKSPKLYFSDTGLLCSLLGDINSGEDLKKDISHRKGAVFENYVVAEIRKSFCNAGCQYHFSYYRETSGAEIDLFIEIGDTIYPIEIKSTMSPDNNDAKNFKVLSNIKDKNMQTPIIIANIDTPTALKDNVLVFPASWI